MFISWQTFEGLKIAVHSIIEAVKFLLQHYVKYVLTEKFSQDPLEIYLGQQKAIGAQKDNPSIHDFRFNDDYFLIPASIENNLIYLFIIPSQTGLH